MTIYRDRLPAWFIDYRMTMSEADARQLLASRISEAKLAGWSSNYWTRVCGLIPRPSRPVKETALVVESGKLRCGRFLCERCRPSWVLNHFDRTLATIRYLRGRGASTYRVRLTLPVVDRTSAAPGVAVVQAALRLLQSGKGWNAFRRRWGWYGWVTQVHDAACASGFRLSVEALVWTRSPVEALKQMLDDLARRWGNAVVRGAGGEQFRPLGEEQAVWATGAPEGEALFIHDEPWSADRSSVGSAFELERPPGGGASIGLEDPWTVEPGPSGWHVVVLEQEAHDRGEVPDRWFAPPDWLIGAAVPGEVAALWDLEYAWKGRRRVSWSSTFGPEPKDWVAPRRGTFVDADAEGAGVLDCAALPLTPTGWKLTQGVARWATLSKSERSGITVGDEDADVIVFRLSDEYLGWMDTAARAREEWVCFWEVLGERPDVPEASGRSTGRAR